MYRKKEKREKEAERRETTEWNEKIERRKQELKGQ
jgi:hypothetical protein